jgi:dihydroxyacetone kinase-like predicted kinase
MPAVDTAIVAVVSGEGLSNVFTSLGATAIGAWGTDDESQHQGFAPGIKYTASSFQ